MNAHVSLLKPTLLFLSFFFKKMRLRAKRVGKEFVVFVFVNGVVLRPGQTLATFQRNIFEH